MANSFGYQFEEDQERQKIAWCLCCNHYAKMPLKKLRKLKRIVDSED